MLLNDRGEKVTGIPEFSKPEYRKPNGDPDWNKYLIDADNRGFYVKHIYPNGTYTKNTILPIGTSLARYGDVGGRLIADDGTPYEKLSLPYKKETVEFHKYKVISPFCVEEGLIALGFDNLKENNKAIQYFSSRPIADILSILIEEDFSWIDELKLQQK